MKINTIIFGATGMIGKGVLIECLEHPEVESVLVIGRRSTEMQHPKLRELIHKDFLDYSAVVNQLKGYYACFFCLGISSVGMSEEDYTRITHDFTIKAAEALLEQNPDMTFCFISGAGTDDTLKSRQMWARVKGKTENDLKAMPFKGSYMFRPAYIQPKKGVRSATWWYQALYDIMGFMYPVWKALFPGNVSTTIEVGQAMINSVLFTPEKQTLESRDIVELAYQTNA